MLTYLKGKIVLLEEDGVVMEVGGMGIKIITTQPTLKSLKEGESCKISTYLHIQENKWEIFGFSNKEEREAFLLLNSFRGVGPRAALNILSSISPASLREIALGKESTARLQQVNGIGRKTAERIVVELKDKLEKMVPWQGKASKGTSNHDDLVTALQNLGYKPSEVHSALSEMSNVPDSLPEAVREVLKYLGKNR